MTISSFLDVVSENVGAKLKDMPIREASIRTTPGWTCRMLGELKEAGLYLERAFQLRQEHFGREYRETLTCMGRLGWVDWDQGRFEKGKQRWSKELEICHCVFGDHL